MIRKTVIFKMKFEGIQAAIRQVRTLSNLMKKLSRYSSKVTIQLSKRTAAQSISQAAGAMRRLAAQTQRLSKNLNTSVQQVGRLARAARRVGRIGARSVGGISRGMERGVSWLGGKLRGLSSMATGLITTMGGLSLALLTKETIEFDYAIRQALAQSDLSVKEIPGVVSRIRDEATAAAQAVGVSRMDIAESTKRLFAAVLPGKLEEFLREKGAVQALTTEMAQLGELSFSGIRAAVDGLIILRKSYPKMEDSRRLSLLFAVFRLGVQNMDEASRQLSKIIQTAKQVGVAPEQALALEAISSHFGEVNEMTTALRRTFTSLGTEAFNVYKLLDVGVAKGRIWGKIPIEKKVSLVAKWKEAKLAEDFRAAFGKKGEPVDFVKILRTVHKAVKMEPDKMIQAALYREFLTRIRGQLGFSMLTSEEETLKTVEKAQKYMEHAASGDISKRYKRFLGESPLIKFRQILASIVQIFQSTFLPIITQISKALQPWVEKLSAAIKIATKGKEGFDAILASVETIGKFIARAIDENVSEISNAVSKIVSIALGVLKASTEIITAIVRIFKEVLKAVQEPIIDFLKHDVFPLLVDVIVTAITAAWDITKGQISLGGLIFGWDRDIVPNTKISTSLDKYDPLSIPSLPYETSAAYKKYIAAVRARKK